MFQQHFLLILLELFLRTTIIRQLNLIFLETLLNNLKE